MCIFAVAPAVTAKRENYFALFGVFPYQGPHNPGALRAN
jgi:hypothetical protein